MEKRNTAFTDSKTAFDEKTNTEWEAKQQGIVDGRQAAADANGGPETDEGKAAMDEIESLDADDKGVFDEDEWYAAFDDENPAGEIPDEVEEDLDNDFNIEIKDDDDD